jgi:hypothetical protein
VLYSHELGSTRAKQTATDRCGREQIGRVADAAHEEQPVNSYQLRRACPEVLLLCVNIQGIREQLSWALSDDSANALRAIAKRYSLR